MNACYSKYCSFNLPGHSKPVHHQRVACPLCKTAIYCSQKCRDMDWTSHKNICKPMTLPMLTAELPGSDTATTLRQMKRKPEDFELVQQVSQLGRGSFGAVKLVKDRSNGTLFAMKIMNKREIFEFCSVENLKREIRIQRKLMHPNVTKLYHYFEDKEKVYLILEYAQNGSLFQYLRKKNTLTEQEAFVYFFQTCLAIDYLHKQHIIHRDLKPENLLLDKDGNIKICDFGWSAEILLGQQKRTTFCGTIDYMAPEMIENRPHDFTLDLWCLGVLLYEFLHGTAPFKGRNELEKCKNIVLCQGVEYSPRISTEAKSLISCLLKYNQSERLMMHNIFHHLWMIKMAKLHMIDIDSYIYQSGQTSSILTQSGVRLAEPYYQKQFDLKDQKLTATTTDSYDPRMRSNQSQHQTAPGPAYDTPRVSRLSMRNHHNTEIKGSYRRHKTEVGLIDRIMISLGCIARPKEEEEKQQR